MKTLGEGMQGAGFLGFVALGCMVGATVPVVIATTILCCTSILVGKFLVGYEIYLKRERSSKRITRYRKANKKSA